MSVSYGIVKSLGGDIEVESQARRGTTFTIVIPERRGSVLARAAS
jgi:signal transduction histidine kinase